MKKIFIVWILLLSAAPLTWAKSTCETRVDKHPYSSTIERVDYCLYEGEEEEKTPKVITYTVTTKTQSPATPQKDSSRRQSYFKKKKVTVSRSYVTSNRFPVWENDIQSEQERLSQKPQKTTVLKTTTQEEPAQLQGVYVSGVDGTPQSPLGTSNPRVHGVVVSTTKTSEERSSTTSQVGQPVQTVTTSRTVSSKTISNTPPQTPVAFGKTIEKTAANTRQTADETLEEADALFNESAAQALGLADQSYNRAQTAAEREIERVNTKVDNALAKTEQQVDQATQRAQNKADKARQKTDALLVDVDNTLQNSYNRAQQRADKQIQKANAQVEKSLAQTQQMTNQAANQTQAVADQAAQTAQEADELFNDWNY